MSLCVNMLKLKLVGVRPSTGGADPPGFSTAQQQPPTDPTDRLIYDYSKTYDAFMRSVLQRLMKHKRCASFRLIKNTSGDAFDLNLVSTVCSHLTCLLLYDADY